jgi:hypothetical protein
MKVVCVLGLPGLAILDLTLSDPERIILLIRKQEETRENKRKKNGEMVKDRDEEGGRCV